MSIKIAVFFNTKADRDSAYAALKMGFTGVDHGVSGDGAVDQWQVWATCDAIDLTEADKHVMSANARACDGKSAVTLVAAKAK